MSGERIDWNLPDETLAHLVRELPDGTDLGMHPMSDLLVGRNGAPRAPKRYSQIYSIAAEGATTDWMRLACRIQECNGARRMSDVDLARVEDELNDIAKAVVRLPAGLNQQVLGGEVAYHQGIVYRGLRDYRTASRAQLFSSIWLSAAGQHDKARVAIFVAAVEDMNAALVEGNITAIAEAFHYLRLIRDVVRTTCDPYPRWMHENAAIHVWWAHLLTKMLGIDVAYPEPEGDSVEVDETSFRHWKLVYDVSMEYAYTSDICPRADEALRELASSPSSSVGDALLTIRLLKACHLLRGRRTKDAHPLLEEVAAWDGQDGGVPIAIAKVKLASMA